MKKILALVVMVSLVCLGFLIPPREAGALTINFRGLTGDPVPTGLLGDPWVYQGVSVRANSSLLSPDVTFNSGGLGVLGGLNTDGSVNNRQTGLPRNFLEGLVFHVPDNMYFTSITFSGLEGSERAYIRAVEGWDLGDMLGALVGDSMTGFIAVSNNLPVNVVNLFGNNDWQWILVRTPTYLVGGAVSFYVADVTVESAAVPEPATLILLGCGLIGLGVFRRVSKKS